MYVWSRNSITSGIYEARKTLLCVIFVLFIFEKKSLDVAKVLVYEVLDPETKVMRVRSYGF